MESLTNDLVYHLLSKLIFGDIKECPQKSMSNSIFQTSLAQIEPTKIKNAETGSKFHLWNILEQF